MTSNITEIQDSMKVGIVMTTYSPDLTGQHARMNDVLRYVRRNTPEEVSYEVFVLSLNGQPGLSDSYALHHKDGGKIARGTGTLSHLIRTRHDVDLIHLIELPAWIGFPLELASIGKPLIVGPNVGGRMFPWSSLDATTREVIAAEKPSLLRRWRWYGERTERVKLRFARSQLYPTTHFLAFSEWVQNEILARRGIPTDDVTVLPSGVPTDIFCPLSNIKNKSNERGKIKLLFVGKPTRRKGIGVLAEAVTSLNERDLEVEVLVAGSDAPPQWLSDSYTVSDNFEFLGRVPRGDLPTYYNTADAYVCPSYYEMESTSMIEALACGTPCIATAGEAFREVCDGNGLFFKRGNPSSLADTILRLYNNMDTWKERATRQSGKYNIEQTFKTIVDTYSKVIG